MQESALSQSVRLLESGLLAGDVGHDVTHRLKLFSLFVGDFDVKFLFESHDKLDGVEGVGAEVLDKSGFGGDLISADAKLVYDDILYTGFDTFV